MIKRRFYKHEHDDKDVPSDSDSSSDSELEAKSTEEESEEEDVAAAEVRQNDGHCSSSSGLFILSASAFILDTSRDIQFYSFTICTLFCFGQS